MSLAKTARAGPLMLETDTAATLCQTPRLPVTPEARGSSPLHPATREAGIPREADGVPASMFSGIGARARLPPRWRDRSRPCPLLPARPPLDTFAKGDGRLRADRRAAEGARDRNRPGEPPAGERARRSESGRHPHDRALEPPLPPDARLPGDVRPHHRVRRRAVGHGRRPGAAGAGEPVRARDPVVRAAPRFRRALHWRRHLPPLCRDQLRGRAG